MGSGRLGRALVLLAIGGLMSVVGIVAAPSAFAASLTVTTAADSGAGSLRDTVAAAAPGDSITFSSALNGVPIQISGFPIVIGKNLTIRGNGAFFTVISRTANAGAIFNIDPATVTIDSLTITNVDAAGTTAIVVNSGATLNFTRGEISKVVSNGNSGGLVNVGTTTIRNSIIRDNQAFRGAGLGNVGTMTVIDSVILGNKAAALNSSGGGIQSIGPLTLINTDVLNNSTTSESPGGSAEGGGIWSGGSLTMTDGAIRGNIAQGGTEVTAAASGGGLYIQGTSAVLDRVEVSGNKLIAGGALPGAGKLGAGIRVAFSGSLTSTNSTLASNDASTSQSQGGAIDASGGTPTTSLISTTLAGNTAASASNIAAGGTFTVKDTILANSGPGGMCTGVITDSGNNMTFGGSLGTCPGTVTDPLLAGLASNGGPTQTMALSDTSPAVNAGSATCPPVDQRQFPRNVGACDIGAFEFGSSLGDINPPTCAVSAIRSDDPKQMDVTVTDGMAGLSFLSQTLLQNGVINFPYFQPGSRNPVVVTATKTNQALQTRWGFDAFDLQGQKRSCI